ncbi:MAG: hypothetical protein EXS10_06345 [Phycisphaerales bacterium]|nr:hypothetical protein [Phycisphaerales bacterium]
MFPLLPLITLTTILQAALVVAPPTDDAVGVLLDRLEAAGKTLTTLVGRVSLEKQDALVGDNELRLGRLVLEQKEGARSFAFLFEEFIDANGRADRHLDHWIYADGWLCELDERNKSFTKRQIVAPGQSFDPLKLGEGPFPIPTGQPKREVLARFDVVLAPIPTDVPLLKTLANVDGLRLTPKAGSGMEKEFKSVEVFYDHDTLAPVGVRLTKPNLDTTVVRIAAFTVNAPLSDADRSAITIPNPDPKQWAIDVRPWKSAVETPAQSAPTAPSAAK